MFMTHLQYYAHLILGIFSKYLIRRFEAHFIHAFSLDRYLIPLMCLFYQRQTLNHISFRSMHIHLHAFFAFLCEFWIYVLVQVYEQVHCL